MFTRYAILAQATQVPNNGASNAEDFQPQTRNPQAEPLNTQQTDTLQDPSSLDILNNQNAQIVVPQGTPAEAVRIAPRASSGLVTPWLFLVLVIIFGISMYFWRKRGTDIVADPPMEPSTPQPVAPVVVAAPKQEKKAASQPKKQVKKKSKSKRKKSRK